MPIRAAFYVDGFNVYHSLDDLQRPHYKWLDWWALGELLIPSKSETLVRVAMCTALKTSSPEKLTRHRTYLKALEARGVECLRGHFINEKRNCNRCSAEWQAPVEKQGDVNLAISLIADAHKDVFDHAYLVTADSDQAATARMLKADFPDKKLTTVVITGRSHSKEIVASADATMTINTGHIERCLLPKLLPGAEAILRPTAYDPPGG
jgi:hypothetical protein